jgi:hypothetical protein
LNKDDSEACDRLLADRAHPDEFKAGYAAACEAKEPTIENLLVMIERCVTRTSELSKKLEHEHEARNILIQGLEDIGSGAYENYIKLAWTAVSDYWRFKKRNNHHE